ncbi:peptidylprolyl isomerase [Pseudonocardia asaccharolytica]|uniref:Peptidyl-prolyl cis-trans isomerase n=1 Tax=Pseudonocardia asaccharolytica DSM 44247 = NBRC 16224 TaxID=1123024 RepID=A0A511D628_9PSEU|nr:peptidylprolyl isomerase [Pseudonocardia asaccharolytica]GEL19054.1 peptidyl-prolyl cis-trans isomerase [Pseudonocardia asaccharolytica DSM 44247 = NBRC 16224]
MATNQMRREAAKRKLARQQERRALQAKRRKQITMITSAAVVVVVVVAVVLLTTLGGSGGSADTTDPAAAGISPERIPTDSAPLPTRPTALPATVNCAYPASGDAARPVQPPATADISAQGTVPVTLETSSGAIPLTLDRALAPCTVNSFVSLAQQGYFDGTGCHRLTTSAGLQVLQCGDPTGTGGGGPGYTFADETFPELTYGRGLLAMANAGPDTNGSQFFMIYGDAQLPPNYAVFGSISADGLAVIDRIAQAGHDGSLDPVPGGGKPLLPVTIEKAAVQ